MACIPETAYSCQRVRQVTCQRQMLRFTARNVACPGSRDVSRPSWRKSEMKHASVCAIQLSALRRAVIPLIVVLGHNVGD
mmetsp:Transcript_63725/g.151907  ORF Transcript_63725/g.151907 Transcript_63725/m.151907 type:complete len:80 (+) Transcript_63725:2585-2824(+)